MGSYQLYLKNKYNEKPGIILAWNKVFCSIYIFRLSTNYINFKQVKKQKKIL